MDSSELAKICREALADDKYVYLYHRGVARDVYPFSIREGRLYCFCSLHPDREVESMWLSNINTAVVSGRTIGYTFGYESEFAE